MRRSTRSICSALLALTSFSSLTLGQAVTGQLGNAIENLKNPTGSAYIAVLNGPQIKGRIIALDAQEKGTEFSVMFMGLPEGGPFGYHVHVMPVEADGNCTKTLAHLDPFVRGEVTPCMKERPETCQVGDLAGKHGPMKPAGPDSSYVASFMDPYVSLTPGMGSFFGNRSFVIHMPDKTRIACANFLPADQALGGMAGMPPALMPPPGMIPAPPVVPGGNAGNQGAQQPAPVPAQPPVAGSPGNAGNQGQGVPPAGGAPIPGAPIPGMPIPIPGSPIPGMELPIPGMPIPVMQPQPQGQRGQRGKGGRGGQGQGRGPNGGRGGSGGGYPGGGGPGGFGGQGGGFGPGGFGLDADVNDAGVPGGPKDQAAQFPGPSMPQNGIGGVPQQGQQGGAQGPKPGAGGLATIHKGASSRTTSVSISALAAVFFIAAFAL